MSHLSRMPSSSESQQQLREMIVRQIAERFQKMNQGQNLGVTPARTIALAVGEVAKLPADRREPLLDLFAQQARRIAHPPTLGKVVHNVWDKWQSPTVFQIQLDNELKKVAKAALTDEWDTINGFRSNQRA